MRIAALAKSVGVTPDTIRYYEREGLLPLADRTPSGYRDYGPEVVDDLRFIKKAQALGLKLSDVRERQQSFTLVIPDGVGGHSHRLRELSNPHLVSSKCSAAHVGTLELRQRLFPQQGRYSGAQFPGPWRVLTLE